MFDLSPVSIRSGHSTNDDIYAKSILTPSAILSQNVHQLFYGNGFNGTFANVRLKNSTASRYIAVADAIDSNDAAWSTARVPG